LILLTLFVFIVINRNLNDLNDKEWLLRDTLVKMNENPAVGINSYNVEIERIQNHTRSYEVYIFILQRLGLILFVSSVITIAFGLLI